MKAVILAGGFGTRISEETHLKPKPMVEIGERPILWHLMKIYEAHGIKDFIICCGYKGHVIKEYFANYYLFNSDITVDLAQNEVKIHRPAREDWQVTLVDTGENTMTGGRLRRVADYLDSSEPFCFTYGDGLGDVDIGATVKLFQESGCEALVTAVQPPGRFGSLVIDDSGQHVTGFQEKPQGDGGWINGGFFVLSPAVIDRISGDDTVWELEPMESLARDGQLCPYFHRGWWHPMDTLRDRQMLERLWKSGNAPWKIW
ncbi:MAG: glucose-1-phosphate cytidylyltransferase [Candidatus Dadabacteria bacterium]|nr:MAG: glucose-1-phosphate cytidylyltransferase [Candidatus Dadabacteria bacterium]